jgi:hypothetical protein
MDRIAVASFSAVGSVDFILDKLGDNRMGGATIFAKWSGNGSAKIHANFFPDAFPYVGANSADFMDVTSWFVGSAQMTQASARFARFVPGDFMPYALRIEVDSLQAANTVKFAFGW